ncbi:MAG: hypothetical protein KAI79_13875 [Bacteroidales bacterium]|nr:hypothetical protein [Bacteroidales bacterium]
MEKNKLEILINSRIKELGLNNSKVVAKMGYTKLDKGVRKLYNLTQYTIRHKKFISDLAKVLEIEEMEITNLIDEHYTTLRFHEEQIQRLNFLPHICAMGERSTAGTLWIGDGLFSPRYIYFYQEDDCAGDNEKLLSIIKKKIQQHFKNNKGEIEIIGAITHYVLRKDYDEKSEDILVFNLKGDKILEPDENLRLYPEETMVINSYRLPMALTKL